MTLNELIATHCADLGDNYSAIALPTLDDVLAIVPSAERVAIRTMAGFVDDVRRAIDTQNMLYMQTLIEDAVTANAISVQTATALAMLLQRTQPDPAWAATIAGPSLVQAAFLTDSPYGTVTAAQVQAEMNHV